MQNFGSFAGFSNALCSFAFRPDEKMIVAGNFN
jgi:hypothetical protein